VDRIFKVATKKIHKEEFGFRTKEAGVRSSFTTSKGLTQAESLMLSGDLNMAVVEWVVQYRISDPVAYLFNIAEPIQTLRDVAEAKMRRVVGDKGVDKVLTIGRVEVENEVTVAIQATMKQYNTGISIQQVKLKNVKPPEPVQASFNDVNKATQDKQRLENEALATYNDVVPRAEGEAKQRLAAAEGYAVERVNQAKGDAARFKRVYEEYRKAPDVTRRRLYLEAMSRVLPKIKDIVVIDDAGKGILPLLNLGGGAGPLKAAARGGR
jgi:membrane protease subunit HflK